MAAPSLRVLGQKDRQRESICVLIVVLWTGGQQRNGHLSTRATFTRRCEMARSMAYRVVGACRNPCSPIAMAQNGKLISYRRTFPSSSLPRSCTGATHGSLQYQMMTLYSTCSRTTTLTSL